MTEPKIPEAVKKAVAQVIESADEDLLRAIDLWGIDFDDKNTANDWVAFITYYASTGAYSGRQEKYTPENFRKCLSKAAGLCLAAMLAIDRNGNCAPRHYENLPNSGAKTNK